MTDSAPVLRRLTKAPPSKVKPVLPAPVLLVLIQCAAWSETGREESPPVRRNRGVQTSSWLSVASHPSRHTTCSLLKTVLGVLRNTWKELGGVARFPLSDLL